MKLDPSKIKRVLVIGLSCLGDMLLASSALWNLRLFLKKGTHFTLWVPPRAIPAVKGDPLWDLVEVYDRSGTYSGLMGHIKAIRRIRNGRYDLVIDLRSTLMPLFSGASYAPLWGAREMFLSKRIHEAERNLCVMSGFGVPILKRNLRFFITEESRNSISEEYPQLAEKPKCRPFVLFNPGGNEGPPSKCWPVKSFVELGNILASMYNSLIGVIGYTPSEENKAMRILEQLPESNRVDMAGRKMELNKLAAAMECADLFVTDDTGTLHLASAVGVPTVGLFGPSRPERYGPWGNKHLVIVPDLPCAPCCGGTCASGIVDCMAKISVDDVFSSCKELLRSLRP